MSHTWTELDVGVLDDNIRSIRAALSAGTEMIAVVKANAYGHGMLPVARRAWDGGVTWFAVAHVAEATELRDALPGANILIVGVLDPADVEAAIEKEFIPLVVSKHHALALASAAQALAKTLRVQVKIDTGMGRLGFAWEDASRQLLPLARHGGLEFCGICTHFASSDGPTRASVKAQVERFKRVLSACEAAGLRFPFQHASNSGGILGGPDWDFGGVRPGILLYGYGPRLEHGRLVETRPFLQWKTRLVQVKKVPAGFAVSYDSTYVTERETCIGTLGVGYADGYCRSLSNKGFVLVEGQRKPVAGRVSMNLTTVDLGPFTAAKEGDEAVLLGTQGNESIWADEVAGWQDTISYEVLTNIRTDDRRVKPA